MKSCNEPVHINKLVKYTEKEIRMLRTCIIYERQQSVMEGIIEVTHFVFFVKNILPN